MAADIQHNGFNKRKEKTNKNAIIYIYSISNHQWILLFHINVTVLLFHQTHPFKPLSTINFLMLNLLFPIYDWLAWGTFRKFTFNSKHHLNPTSQTFEFEKNSSGHNFFLSSCINHTHTKPRTVQTNWHTVFLVIQTLKL